MSSLNLTLPPNTLRRGSESMMSEGPLTPPSSRPTSPAHANASERVEEEDMTEDSLVDLEDDCDIVVDAEPRFSGPRSQIEGGSEQLHLPPTPASTVSAELPSAEGVPTKPSRLLDDEHSHVQKSGSGSITLRDFEVQGTLGSGTFGRVLLVRLRSAVARGSSQQYFALKVLRKSEVVKLRQVEHVNAERYILSRTRHPFVVDLYATFQDKLNIYMLLSYVPGGELFTHLRRARRFSPDVTRFYLATIVLALKYLHSFNIIYRDLKPENLLLDQRGYLRLTDFGFAKIVDDRTWTLCGTPEYLAPEIVLSEGHGKAADWWACGVLAYEMMVGYPPFFDTTPFGIYHKIVHAEVLWPPGIDAASRAFVDALLVKDRSKRLGNMGGGAQDVLDHSWFRGVDWELLERQEIRAPIVPQFSSHGDMRHFLHLPHPPADEIPGLMQDERPPTLHERFDPVAYQFMEF